MGVVGDLWERRRGGKGIVEGGWENEGGGGSGKERCIGDRWGWMGDRDVGWMSNER